MNIELYWNSLPNSPGEAMSYEDLIILWKMDKRKVRRMLHDLSVWDDGSDEIIIRSSKGGFYKTANKAIISAYRKEVLNRGRRVFACLAKVDRVLKRNEYQLNFHNNVKALRSERKMSQRDVCLACHRYGMSLTPSIIAQIECGIIQPSPVLVEVLACVFEVSPVEVAGLEL